MEERVFFGEKGMRLEGLYAAGAAKRGAVVCHPHSLMGGDMHNPVVETLAQAGGVGVKLQGITAAGTFFLASVGNVKFRRQVRPGDVFEMKIHNLRASARLIKQKGLGYVDGELAIEADWLCIVGEETA